MGDFNVHSPVPPAELRGAAYVSRETRRGPGPQLGPSSPRKRASTLKIRQETDDESMPPRATLSTVISTGPSTKISTAPGPTDRRIGRGFRMSSKQSGDLPWPRGRIGKWTAHMSRQRLVQAWGLTDMTGDRSNASVSIRSRPLAASPGTSTPADSSGALTPNRARFRRVASSSCVPRPTDSGHGTRASFDRTEDRPILRATRTGRSSTPGRRTFRAMYGHPDSGYGFIGRQLGRLSSAAFRHRDPGRGGVLWGSCHR